MLKMIKTVIIHILNLVNKIHAKKGGVMYVSKL